MPRVILPNGETAEMGDGQSVAEPISIPGLTEAQREENLQRDMAFLALGDRQGIFSETIAGVAVQPLTSRHMLWLTVLDSCFVTDNEFTEQNAFTELVKLLRVIGVPAKRKWWQRQTDPATENARIMAAAFNGNIEQDMTAVRNYFEQAFADAPASSGNVDKTRYFSNAAWVCYFLGQHLKMTPEQALDTPLKVVWQFMKVHQRNVNPEAPLFNPSDQLTARMLTERNHKN